MSRRLERAAAAVVLALLVVLALTAQFLTPGDHAEAGSAASTESDGRRALLLLLRDLGFRAETWNEAPGALPRGGGLLWMAGTPKHPSSLGDEDEDAEGDPEKDEREPPQPSVAKAPSPAAQGFRAPSHYRRFLEEGGTLILKLDDESRLFLVDELGLVACEDVHPNTDAEAGVRRVRDRRGEEIEVAVEQGSMLLPPPDGSTAEALWWGGTPGGQDEDVLAVMVPVGSGQLVLLGDDSFLANEKLREHDHALLAVRLAEEFARGGRILFDEYALGLWRPRTAMTLLGSKSLLLATLQIAALLLLALWSSAWAREFPRDPRALESASPLLRARALASLLTRAGRIDVLERYHREGTLRSKSRGSRRGSKEMRCKTS